MSECGQRIIDRLKQSGMKVESFEYIPDPVVDKAVQEFIKRFHEVTNKPSTSTITYKKLN